MELGQTLKRAEQLHRKLAELHEQTAVLEELTNVFGEIRPLHDELVTALAARQPDNDAGLLLTRVRMDAEFRARVSDAEGMGNVDEVWQHYRDLHEKLCGAPAGHSEQHI